MGGWSHLNEQPIGQGEKNGVGKPLLDGKMGS